MAGNTSLGKAKKAKEDEFYTKIADIEREMGHYTEHFKGKTIFCNCDDPLESNFWLFFQLNFYQLGLKKLVSTHYEESKPSYKLEIVSTDKKIGKEKQSAQIGIPDVIKTPLQQNGDFRSPECIEILKEADIVITNPPFSLFRDYIAQLMEYEKKFIVIGSQNALTYKEIFPLLRDNKIWIGYNSGDMEFVVPSYYEPRETRYREENGIKYRSMGNICWYTNIDIEKRHELMLLYREYKESEYPTYENYDGIDVAKVSDIPMDYYGNMGVPITYFEKHNPEQFEIVGYGKGALAKEIGVKKNYRGRTDLAYTKGGRNFCPFGRAIIRRKEQKQ